MEKDLLRDSILSVRVLHLDNLDQSKPSPGDGDQVEKPLLRAIQDAKLRSFAFYDEVLPFHIQLEVKNASLTAEGFESFASSLNVLVNTKIAGSQGNTAESNSRHSHQSKNQEFEIFSTVVDSPSSLVYCGKDLGSEEESKWVALWRVSIDVSHPRTRLYKPHLVIDVTAGSDCNSPTTTAASLRSHSAHPSQNNAEDVDQATPIYLDEFMPAEDVNVFETLSADNRLKETTKLSLNRVSSQRNRNYDSRSSIKSPLQSRSSTPTPQFKLDAPPAVKNQPAPPKDASSPKPPSETSPSTHNHVATIMGSVRLPVFPAVNLRLRCTKSTGSQNSIVAILEIENSDSAQFNVLIKSAHLEFTAGSAVLFGDCSFPMWLSPGENFSMAYQLSHADAGLLKSRVKPMTILLHSVPVMSDISETSIINFDHEKESFNYADVGPLVLTKWDTVVDFGVAAIPGAASALAPVALGSASGAVKKLFKVGRTASVTSLRSAANGAGNSVGDPYGGTESMRESRTNTITSQLNGFLISFSGPSAVKVGEVFKWRVFAVNKSPHQRHLTLYIQPREKGFRANAQNQVLSNNFSFDKQLPQKPETSPILDRSQLLKLYEDCQQLSASGSTGIVSLTNDVRIGPLQANACFETEISMLALVTGQYSLEGLCVIDLTSGDSYDCGKLLDVVITE